jgi:hypothetical protein
MYLWNLGTSFVRYGLKNVDVFVVVETLLFKDDVELGGYSFRASCLFKREACHNY